MLPPKLNARDVKGWAQSKIGKLGRLAKANRKAKKPKTVPPAKKTDPQVPSPDDEELQVDPKTGLPINPDTGKPDASLVPQLKKQQKDKADAKAGKKPAEAADEDGDEEDGVPSKAKAKPAAKDKASKAKKTPPKDPAKKAPTDPNAKPSEEQDQPDDGTQDAADPRDPKAKDQPVPVRAQPVDGKLPSTEPRDPMNRLGLDGMGAGEDSLLGQDLAEIAEKLGDFAEVMEHRASDLEDAAGKVQGDLTSDLPDQETVREAQAAIPDDIKRELVEAISALDPDEIEDLCEHLKSEGRISDPDLLAGFLRAATTDTAKDEDGDEEPDLDDDEGESETDSDEDV